MKSDKIKKGVERAGARSLLYATGISKEDMAKPFIAVASSRTAHLRRFPHPSSLRRTTKYALRPAHQLAGVARGRSLFVATPLSGFRDPCIWAFLSSLRKMIISAGS